LAEEKHLDGGEQDTRIRRQSTVVASTLDIKGNGFGGLGKQRCEKRFRTDLEGEGDGKKRKEWGGRPLIFNALNKQQRE